MRKLRKQSYLHSQGRNQGVPILRPSRKEGGQVKVLILTLSLIFPISAFAGQMQASWYSYASLRAEGTWKHGEQKMANGKRFDENALTAAAGKQYKLGTVLLVTNIRNGKTVRVVVTDRIGRRFSTTRVDLTKRAFQEIGNLKDGLISVNVEVL